MALCKEHRSQVEAILKDLICEADPDVEGKEIVIKRIWRKGDLVMARYLTADDEVLSQVVRMFGGRRRRGLSIGYSVGHIMEEKKQRFGSGALAYV